MRRFPRLKVIVAHAGADEFDAFFDLCGSYESVYLDTAMVYNRFPGRPAADPACTRVPGSRAVRQRLPEHPVRG